MESKADFDFFMIGFNSIQEKILKPILGDLKPLKISTQEEVLKILEHFEVLPGTVILISSSISNMSHLEIAQAFSSYFQGTKIVFATWDRDLFQLEALKINGFQEQFFLPHDMNVLSTFLQDTPHPGKSITAKKYRAVKLVDLQPNQDLPFDVLTFLPGNNKYITVTASGQLSEKKCELLKKSNTNSVFIESQKVAEFYAYTAKQLIHLTDVEPSDCISQTEKQERSQKMVRDLFKVILDSSKNLNSFENSRDLVNQSKKVIESFVKHKTGLNLAEKLKELIGEAGDSYSHAQHVSTIACLLSMATGIGKPEDLAIAGLFHDIGLINLNHEISVFELDQLSTEEKDIYMKHPTTSLAMLKEKWLTTSPEVNEIIDKHHERADGTGFPKQLPSHKIPHEAHLLAYADAFEHLTRPRPNQANKTPYEAHQIIEEKLSISFEVLKKIEKFLLENNK
jgi:HD-GYP domain-containing protein (c-di-GMP phosphodiesterase class II)